MAQDRARREAFRCERHVRYHVMNMEIEPRLLLFAAMSAERSGGHDALPALLRAILG